MSRHRFLPVTRMALAAIVALPAQAAGIMAQTPAPMADAPPPRLADSSVVVRVSADRPLDVAEPLRPHTESHLSVNPRDGRQMLAISMMPSDPIFGPTQDCAVFASFDGGGTWARRALGVRNCVDPWSVILRDGSALVGVMSGSRFLVFRSEDGGRTWGTPPVDLGTGHDHVMLSVDTTSGPYGGSVYAISARPRRVPDGMHFGVFVARSGDGGRSFSDSVTHVIGNVNMSPDRGLAMSDGSLLIMFTDGMRNVDGFMTQRGRLERARSWAVRSTDGGKTIGPLLLASEGCGRGGGFPTAEVRHARAGETDRFYILCASRSRSEILIIRSVLSLERWSEPARVDVASRDSVTRRTAGIAINRDGVVGVSWFEQAPGRAPDCMRVMFAASYDDGVTFSPAVRVSSSDFCVATPGNAGSAARWPAGGEYSGFAAAPDGSFRFVWPDSRSGVYQLRYASAVVQRPLSSSSPSIREIR